MAEADYDDWHSELRGTAGVQAGAGVHEWLLGAEARFVWATARIGGGEVPLDGVALAVNLGYR